jgi:hypothetical protein
MTTTAIVAPALHLPAPPLDAWEPTKDTLHLYAQMVGKVRLRLHPKLNHWWHTTLYVSPRGLTTRANPYGELSLELTLDLIDHVLRIATSRGEAGAIALPGRTVAEVYAELCDALADLRIPVTIDPRPYRHRSTIPFPEDGEHGAYDEAYVRRYHQLLVTADGILKSFSGRFHGKQAPVHLFWHSFDLVLTRFSGRKASPLGRGTRVDREGYTHEVISFGFWPGDDWLREPAFYSYTYPEPEGLTAEPLRPETAAWRDHNGALAILRYDDVARSPDPAGTLLAFLESAYQAGARRADWPIADLAAPSASCR